MNNQKSTHKFSKGVSYVIGTLTKRSNRHDPKFSWQRTFLGQNLIERGIKSITDLINNDKTVEPFDPSQTYYIYEVQNGVLMYFAEFSPNVRMMQQTQYVQQLQTLSDNTQTTTVTPPQPDLYFNHTVNAQKENAKSLDRICSLLEKQLDSVNNQIENVARTKNQEIQIIIEQKQEEIERLTQTYDNQITVLESQINRRDKIIADLQEKIISLNNDISLEREKFKAAITLQEAKDFVKGKEIETAQTYEKKIQAIQKNVSNAQGGMSGLTETLPTLLSIAKEVKAIFSDVGTNTGQIEMKGVADKPKPRAIIGQPPSVNRMPPPSPVAKAEEKVEVMQ